MGTTRNSGQESRQRTGLVAKEKNQGKWPQGSQKNGQKGRRVLAALWGSTKKKRLSDGEVSKNKAVS